ncbi:hypothetical protein VZT92_015113 [Zoarces viviparus]|uniref:Uncharacterized protein n=1 Tax=Zoarces viviparus TaxID=48416 RepID=A0AAW1EW04_ZOAVI
MGGGSEALLLKAQPRSAYSLTGSRFFGSAFSGAKTVGQKIADFLFRVSRKERREGDGNQPQRLSSDDQL